jgi:hypothetical protein
MFSVKNHHPLSVVPLFLEMELQIYAVFLKKKSEWTTCKVEKSWNGKG